MSNKTYVRKKYVVLIRKMIFEHEMTFVGISKNSADATSINGTWECILNEEIPITIYDQQGTNSTAQLHILQKNKEEEIELGFVSFETKSEKILKPLSKQFFSKQLHNKKGYIEYKFVGVQTKNVTEEEMRNNINHKNQLMVQLGQHNVERQQIDSLIALISEKDQVIAKMDLEIQRLIKETRKLNRSLSKQKEQHSKIDRNVNLNIKLNHNLSALHKNHSNLHQTQREQYNYQIEKLQRNNREHQNREKQYREEIENLTRKMESYVKNNERKISDLRKEIQERYEREEKENSGDEQDSNKSWTLLEADKIRKNQYIEEQLAEQIRKIEAEKAKQIKKDIEHELRQQLERQYQKEKQRERQKERQREFEYQREREKQREKQRAKLSSFRDPSNEDKEYERQIRQLQNERRILKDKISLKDQQFHEIVEKLARAQKQIKILDQQNLQLRKTKSALLRQVEESNNLKTEALNSRTGIDIQSIQSYEKMILNERKQINDEKLRAQIQELKNKNRKQQRDYRQKLEEKELEIKRLQLSEKGATKEKQIYANRIKQIMQSTEGERKKFLQALQSAHKLQTQVARTKQLEIMNAQLDSINYKNAKEKQELQNTIKKMKSKLDEQESQWTKLKSAQSQFNYYKTQCEKMERANQNFEKRYESVKERCSNLEHIVGKKPKKTDNDELNLERQQKYKNEIRNRLQIILQEIRDMENKFHLEQVQNLTTNRMSIVQLYARRFEDDRIKIMEMEGISQAAKQNLVMEKEKEISSLKENQVTDLDNKVIKLKLLMRKEEQHQNTSSVVDRHFIQETFKILANKIDKLREESEMRKKQFYLLKEKNEKIEHELKQKSLKLSTVIANNEQNHSKKSYLYIPQEKKQEGISKFEDVRRSYLDEFKKSRDLFMNKPFEELKKLNTELQADKRRVETDMNSLKFSFDKERVQMNDKIRTKEREIKKFQHEASGNEKTIAKLTNDIESFRKNRDELENLIKKMRQELKEVSRTLQIKQRQCSQALNEIKRRQNNIKAYEEAEKQMFDDVKKMKEKFLKKEVEMDAILEEKTERSKQLDSERVLQISKLEQKLKDTEFKLQREISQNLTVKNLNENLSQKITEYDAKLKENEQQIEVLNETFNIYKIQYGEKAEELEEQNNLLQNNLLQIADEMSKKETENCQFQIKLEYSEKRQEALKRMKQEVEGKNADLKIQIQRLEREMRNQYDKFMEQVRGFDSVKEKIEFQTEQNTRLQFSLQNMELQLREKEQEKHELQITIAKTEGQIIRLQTIHSFNNQKIEEQTERIKSLIIEKDSQIQKILRDRERDHSNSRSRKSSEGAGLGIELNPNTGGQKKLLNTSMNRSSSLVYQQQKSNRQINTSLLRKSSSKDNQEDNEQSSNKEGFNINIIQPPLRPVEESNDDLKGTMLIPKRESVHHDSSKVDIDVNQSDDGNGNNQKYSNFERSSIIDKNKDNNSLKAFMEDGSVKIDQSFGGESYAIGNQDHENDNDKIHYNSQEKDEHNIYEGHDSSNEEYQINNRGETDEQYYQRIEMQNEELRRKVEDLQFEIERIEEQKNGYFEQLKVWKRNYENELPMGTQLVKVDSDREKQSLGDLNFKQQAMKRSPSIKSPADSNQQINDRSNQRKVQIMNGQMEELKNKIIEYQVMLAENENIIKQLQQQKIGLEQGNQKLIYELKQLMKQYEDSESHSKHLENQIAHIKAKHSQQLGEVQGKIQQQIIQDLRKDESIKQLLEITSNTNKQIKNKDVMISSLNTEISKLKANINKNNQIINGNKIQYRKYQEESQLQILKFKQNQELFNQTLEMKDLEIAELAQRYIQLEQQLQSTQSQLQVKSKQVLTERSKLKQAFDMRNQALNEMRKFDSIKSTHLAKIRQLEIKLADTMDELKLMTKQTAIQYKKYEIQLETEKEQHSLSRKKIKQRQEHISTLKMEIANYNDICHDLEKQKNSLAADLNKIQKELRQIMISYQGELDGLNKDKLILVQQLEKHTNFDRQNSLKIELLNKEITKKNREIKEICFKVEQQNTELEKIKEKNRLQKGALIGELEVKNDEYEKIKIQLERESEHYFTKQSNYLLEKQKKQKTQKEYIKKLQQYETIIKQVQQQLQQIQNRPSSEQWEEVCFENQLYKNRIEQLESLQRENGNQEQERLKSQFKKYRINKEREVQDLETEMEKYIAKFNTLQENNYIIKKDNESMKTQLRTVMQERLKLQKNIKNYEDDISELKEQLVFYKTKRNDDLNKLLNESYS